MSESLGERLGFNEATFRTINEGIERGHVGEPEQKGYLCECARLGCTTVLELTPAEYERVRAHPRLFLVVPGHEEPAAEVVVEHHGHYDVIEKRGDAGDVARGLDPRP